MKKIFKLFTENRQKVDFSIEPHPAYNKLDLSDCHRWNLFICKWYHWELIGEFYTLKQAHETAEQIIKDQNIQEYDLEVDYAR